MEVEKVGLDAFEQEAFGRQSSSSAYLLFYRREQDPMGQFRPFDFSDRLDLSAVEADNLRFAEICSVFQPAAAEFVVGLRDLDAGLLYLVRVLCHSRLAKEARALCESLRPVRVNLRPHGQMVSIHGIPPMITPTIREALIDYLSDPVKATAGPVIVPAF
jgi:hypothetical protein